MANLEHAAVRPHVFMKNDATGTGGFIEPVSPSRWRGEAGVVVGPFSGREIANHFCGHRSDFGRYEAYSFRVFASRDAWYVDVLPTGLPGEQNAHLLEPAGG